MRTAVAVQAAAAVIVTAAWLIMLRGLWCLPIDPRPELDLEAGAAFAVNLTVSLPAMGLTVVFFGLLVGGALARFLGVAVALVALSVVSFGLWVLTFQDLLDYLPGLFNHLWISFMLSAIAVLVVGAAVLEERRIACSRRQGPTANH